MIARKGDRGSVESRVRQEYEGCSGDAGEDWSLSDAAAFCADRVGCSVEIARAALASYFPKGAQ